MGSTALAESILKGFSVGIPVGTFGIITITDFPVAASFFNSGLRLLNQGKENFVGRIQALWFRVGYGQSFSGFFSLHQFEFSILRR
jgi:hypothetical protein